MISPAERARLVAQADAALRDGSKSFALASRLFDRETREHAQLLYAWCRNCDDLCDGQTLGQGGAIVDRPGARLAVLTAGTEAALDGHVTGESAFDGLAIVASECRLPRQLLHEHLRGFAMDLEGWRPETEQDLLRYCYHVAGVVGCLMALVMGTPPDDEETLDRASDLGIAFQLANIARDLVDDHHAGRCYVPAAWLRELELTPATFADVDKRERLAIVAERLARLAAAYEASGRIGARSLRFRARWAVLAAAGIYGSIGRLTAQRRAQAWDSRTVVGSAAKAGWAGKALLQALRSAGPDSARRELWTRPRSA